MKIKIYAVDKLKKEYNKLGTLDYLERIKYYIPIEVYEVTEEKLKKLISKEHYNIVLDEKGKELTSTELSQLIQKLLSSQNKDIAFFIGGSEGFSNEIKGKADFTLSLSKLTFPHELVRVILLEQIYRAFTIINNEKYHK
ncbi:23S rRNA (pseudouridine(1915)-N(3))-methyltransferase RlmH [Caldisericum sp. AR60]|uniref:23S rRNA (pseudouridine(1915)-N(3))-methyltransferase RlmH n=1 Tax=Caldisericum sp. AR60 TaxID=3397852 RepID=UPI0039FDA37C